MPTTKPVPLQPIFENFPTVLKSLHNWVLWEYVLKDDKWTKVPKMPDRSYASTAKPLTWSAYDDVREAYESRRFDGVGIVLSGEPLESGLYLIGLDFDHCINDALMDEGPKNAIERLDTYCEISPSGEGVRIFLLHDKLIRARKNNVEDKSREVYSQGRYLTVTGHIIGEAKEVNHVS